MHSILLYTHIHTHIHVGVHIFIYKKVYTIEFVNRTNNAEQHVVISCSVDAWESEYRKLIGSVQDLFMFKQE
jgi:hypothetical protein